MILTCVYISVMPKSLTTQTKHFAETKTNFPIDFNLRTIYYDDEDVYMLLLKPYRSKTYKTILFLPSICQYQGQYTAPHEVYVFDNM